MAHARQTTLFGGWTNEQPTTSQTADDDWGKSSKSGVADTSSATQANIWSVCLHRAVLCVLIVVCRDCVKAAGSEFRRIKKEHPGGVAAWLQEQNKQPTPGAKPKLRLGSLTRATEMTKASRVPPSVLCCNPSQGIKELSLTLT